MSFEIKEKDLLARIGRLRTKSGTIETPLLFPVVNPVKQTVSPRKMREQFGFEALITNAYILRKHASAKLKPNCLHNFLDFKGTIMKNRTTTVSRRPVVSWVCFSTIVVAPAPHLSR